MTVALLLVTPRPKSSLWHSEGEIRFLLLKRAMDLLYASVGTAVEVTKNASSTKEGGASWKMPLAAAAAASYYSLTGPSRRASEVVSSSSLALIQYAWGMVSMPAIKQLSLNASRILKGAAIAERVTIAGFPCFILSRDSSPGKNEIVVNCAFSRLGSPECFIFQNWLLHSGGQNAGRDDRWRFNCQL